MRELYEFISAVCEWMSVRGTTQFQLNVASTLFASRHTRRTPQECQKLMLSKYYYYCSCDCFVSDGDDIEWVEKNASYPKSHTIGNNSLSFRFRLSFACARYLKFIKVEFFRNNNIARARQRKHCIHRCNMFRAERWNDMEQERKNKQRKKKSRSFFCCAIFVRKEKWQIYSELV